ncbi:hypothetical protein L21SP5_03859 [Salinivirga cyanobacteriivorans]|uniref:Uncharacterized protein n=1 Tax=Salinivirga cyanobacteriivorans TaxID=1307839 RepID=A0A0S2I648_9BACT|nr:WYL domain-containing protein [Salinivirga cyanobacteriivorans]ALO17452.1 hypothetical protein L21SP5_03859 [Salinivirga cyanobacteriivorans]
MGKRTQILRYHRIISHLMNAPLSYDELNHKLESDSKWHGETLTRSQRTLQRDIKDIWELYNIEIKAKQDGKYYIISNEQQEFNNRLFEAFDTFIALNIKENVSKDIQFEQRRPQGTSNFSGLLHATQEKLEIKFLYQKFYEEEPEMRHIDPYLLKEFRYRWYIIGKDHKDDHIKSFGLDRIQGLEHTKVHYDSKSKNEVAKRYKDCFGIVSPNAEKPSKVVISCTKIQGRYIQAIPLHHSQHTIKETKDEIVLGMKVYLTYDLFMELLSYGENIKVLEPKSLVVIMKQKLKAGFEQYQV